MELAVAFFLAMVLFAAFGKPLAKALRRGAPALARGLAPVVPIVGKLAAVAFLLAAVMYGRLAGAEFNASRVPSPEVVDEPLSMLLATGRPVLVPLADVWGAYEAGRVAFVPGSRIAVRHGSDDVELIPEERVDDYFKRNPFTTITSVKTYENVIAYRAETESARATGASVGTGAGAFVGAVFAGILVAASRAAGAALSAAPAVDAVDKNRKEKREANDGINRPGVDCPSCRTGNSSDAAFCKKCGKGLTSRVCSCSRRNDADAEFCSGCGRRFDPA